MISSVSGVVRFGAIEQTPALERIPLIECLAMSVVLITHPQGVWTWQWGHWAISRVMGIMALCTLEFGGRPEIGIPIPDDLAMGPVLPIAIDRPMTLSAQLLDMVIPYSPAATQSQFFAIGFVVTVQAGIIAAVLENDVRVLGQGPIAVTIVGKKRMAIVATLVICTKIDHWRVGQRDAERPGFDLLWTNRWLLNERHIGSWIHTKEHPRDDQKSDPHKVARKR